MSQILSPLQPPLPKKIGGRIQWGNLQGTSDALAISAAAKAHAGLIVVMTEDMLSAIQLSYALLFFQTDNVMVFPDWETLAYDYFSPHHDIISERLRVLSRLPFLKKGVLIIPVTTLMQRLPPISFLTSSTFLLKKGDLIDIGKWRCQLQEAGYRAVDQVREHGEFAVRGSLIDIFPMGHHTAYRLDLLDNAIDSIRTFSSETQRSIDKIAEIILLPAKEFPMDAEAINRFRSAWRTRFPGNPLRCPLYSEVSDGIAPAGIEYYFPLFFEKIDTFFSYLPSDALLIQQDQCRSCVEQFYREIKYRYEQRSSDIERPILPVADLFLNENDLYREMKPFSHIRMTKEFIDKKSDSFNFATRKMPEMTIEHKDTDPLSSLKLFLEKTSARILFCAETAGRREILLTLLKSISVVPLEFDSWHAFFISEVRIGITVMPLDAGLYCDDPAFIIISESELYGHRVMQRRRRKTSAPALDVIVKSLVELKLGAPIVHMDHGVGRYMGLEMLTIGENLSEFLAIAYADGDKLYVPVSSLDLISHYTGTDPEQAPLHKLGSEQWSRAKRKAAEKIRDVAAELLDIYAKRAAKPGHAFLPPNEQYVAFASAFRFEETPDQQKAIDEVIADMISLHPMDRLVCGDVGFGKTEVAMRAAFIATQSEKQVAVLVPTTLLARQHFENFQDRFVDWPVHIGILSRFNTPIEQKKTLEAIAAGQIDIVIGTHKILQPNVRFKNLGLLIIDEEHRFGVRQKEKFKSVRADVDILTLTATPIPRTLNMAISGMRDLSIIATPPAKRLSIKTFVNERNDTLIREAILREILRGGQVYFLHNDVMTIQKIAENLRILVPEARIGIGHGQMRERDLEQVMSDFYHRRFNVLVCTTIIETGIDIPSANTILIDRADKFGMAQLYQLRGRVGRSHHQAYAYLFIPSRKRVTADALRRLEAIAGAEELGIGFVLATHDLEIRGAGELLGETQSGSIQSIGFSLYMDMLKRAVKQLQLGQSVDVDDTWRQGLEMDLQLSAIIPDYYLPDVNLRLQFYKKIANAENESALDDIQVEMIDRFGLLPVALKNLVQLTQLKLIARPLGIKKIEATVSTVRVTFEEKPNIDSLRLIKLVQSHPKHYQFEGPNRLRIQEGGADASTRIAVVKKILAQLIKT